MNEAHLMRLEQEAHEMVSEIAPRLRERGETLAVAESAAGGLIAHLLTNLPGSSEWFLAGVVAYSNVSKRTLLGIEESLLETAGAVSAEVAHVMAEGVSRRTGATWGLGETGIAGPQTGRRSAKAAGLVYLAIVGDRNGQKIELAQTVETGRDDRVANKGAFALAALRLLHEALTIVR